MTKTLSRWINNIIWWFKYRITHRYHIISLKSKEYGYHIGWLNRDQALLIASFNILKDFVEKELSPEYFDNLKPPLKEECPSPGEYEDCFEQYQAMAEIKELYDWWTNDRPLAHAMVQKGWESYCEQFPLDFEQFPLDFDDKNNNFGFYVDNSARIEAGKCLVNMEDGLYTKDDQMLKRLIAVRKHMWT